VFKQLIEGQFKLVKKRKKQNKNNKKIDDIQKKICLATLNLLQSKTWSQITIRIILKNSKISMTEGYRVIKQKKDILVLINNYIDKQMIKHIQNIDDSSTKDKLIEVFMIRFEILSEYKKSILRIYDHITKKPDLLIFFLPSLLKSLNLMLEFCNANTDGILGKIKVDVLLFIYVATFLVWKEDKTVGLEKTMAALDNNLNKIDNLIKIFNFKK